MTDDDNLVMHGPNSLTLTSTAIDALRRGVRETPASGARRMVSLKPAEADALLSEVDALSRELTSLRELREDELRTITGRDWPEIVDTLTAERDAALARVEALQSSARMRAAVRVAEAAYHYWFATGSDPVLADRALAEALSDWRALREEQEDE